MPQLVTMYTIIRTKIFDLYQRKNNLKVLHSSPGTKNAENKDIG